MYIHTTHIYTYNTQAHTHNTFYKPSQKTVSNLPLVTLSSAVPCTSVRRSACSQPFFGVTSTCKGPEH